MGEEQVLLLDKLNDCGSVPGRGKDLSLCYYIQVSSESYPTSSSSALDFFSEGSKVAGK
jgi:hypothetical protein